MQHLQPDESPAPCRKPCSRLEGALPSMPARMRLRLLLLALVASLPFVLWSVLPVGSDGPVAWADPEEDRPQQLADRRPQGPRAGADERHLRARRAASTRSQSRHHAALDPPAEAADEPRRQARRAGDRAAPAARGARPADAAARPAAGRPPRARRSGSSSSTRPTRRTRSPSCSSPRASPTCSPAPSSWSASRARTRRSWTSSPTPRRTRPRPPSALDTLEKREARVAGQIESERDEVSTIRVGLVDRRDRIRSARSTKFALLRQLARPPPRARRTTSSSCRPSRRRSRPSWPASPARPPPGRSSPARAG